MHRIQLVFTIHARAPKLTDDSFFKYAESRNLTGGALFDNFADFGLSPGKNMRLRAYQKRIADLLCNPFLIITQELLHSYKSIPGILILHISQPLC